MSIVIKHKKYKNITLTVPGLGTVHIDANGEIETDDEKGAEELLASPGLGFYSEDATASKGKKDESLEDDEDKDENEDEDEEEEDESMSEDEKKAYLDSLSEKSRKDLQQIAIDFELPGGQWRNKNKEELLEYLRAELPAKI